MSMQPTVADYIVGRLAREGITASRSRARARQEYDHKQAIRPYPSETPLMTRLTIALVTSYLGLSMAHASLAPVKERSPFDKLPPPAPKAEAAPEQDGGLVISDDTELKLDGKLCKYEDIPECAEVILVELAKDKKSVLKLHFRTKQVDAAPKMR